MITRMKGIICFLRGFHGTRQPIYMEPFCETCGIYLGEGFKPKPTTDGGK